MIEARGDNPLLNYAKSDATAFRDTPIDRGMKGNSVTRVFGTVKSIASFAANESSLTMINPFMGVYFDNKQGVTVRQPIPNDDIRGVVAWIEYRVVPTWFFTHPDTLNAV